MSKVKTYKCPVIMGPSAMSGYGGSNSSSSFSNEKKRKRSKDSDFGIDLFGKADRVQSPIFKQPSRKSTSEDRDQFDQYFSDVKSLGNATLKGSAGIKIKDDILTNLGVPPPKKQKIPFKMAIGINEGRRKRKEKHISKGFNYDYYFFLVHSS